MVLKGDMGQVEACFGLFGDTVTTQIGVRFAPNVPQDVKSLWAHPMVLLGDKGLVEARFSLFGDSVNLNARQCTVCAKRTIGSEIILDAFDGTPR